MRGSLVASDEPGRRESARQLQTLPDHLKPGLDIVFVGINPGEHSARAGHYFASPRSRFWPALNRSGLLPEELDAASDARVLEFGIGFTDVVKRPTRGASKLRAADYRTWAPVLREKLTRFKPLVVCFHGVTGYRGYLKYAEGVSERPVLGQQPRCIGASRVFVVPNPSPANAAFSLDTLVDWYRRLGVYRDGIVGT